MWPYFLILLIIFVCAISENIKQKASQNVKFTSSILRPFVHILLAFFSGLRFKVGVDYDNYISIFNQDVDYSVNEPGFELLISALTSIGATYQMMFLIMAIITQCFVYNTFKRYAHGFWLATIVYYCFSTFYLASFNGSRQYVAIAICIWALKYVYDKKIVRFLISIILASFCFHYTALLFIPIYYFLQYDYTKKNILFQIICVFFGARFLDFIVSFTPYLVYLERERDMQVHDTVYIFTLLSLFIAFASNKFILIKIDKVLKNMNLLCLYTLILVLIQTSGILIQMMLRINSYFLFAYLCILPNIVCSLKPRMKSLTFLMVVVAAIAYLSKTIVFNGDNYSLVPYKMNFLLFNFI